MSTGEMIKLIPFLVEPMKIDIQQRAGWYEYGEREFLALKEFEPFVIGKIWKVVGERVWEGVTLFLLIRDGEFAQWYPMRYCRVVEGEQ